ncbi:MAG: hypothetical protein ACNA8O_01240 [Cyanobacteriota bacterium]
MTTAWGGCSAAVVAAIATTAILAILPGEARAQVTIGYRNPIQATAFMGVEERRAQRETVQFGIAGVNVRPSDGSLIYDEDTIWRIDQPGRPFSLTVTENNPLLDVRNSDITTRTAQVRRTERVFVQVSGPAAEALRSAFPQDGLRAPDVTLPTMGLSVFGP